MMPAFLSPIGNNAIPFFTQQGVVLAGGMIYTYLAGTTTPQATWTTSTQSVPNANPIVLNSAGLPPQEVWLQQGTSYKFVIQDSQGNTLQTLDNISGINDIAAVPSEWVSSNLTPTYISGTQFSVPGNQTSVFQIGRRVQANVSAGTVWGTITNSAFSTVTTVTVVWDTGQLDSGLSSVSYALMSATHPSIPNALVNVQVFPSAGTFTYTPDPSTVVAHVIVVGGGGGSAGVPSNGGAQVSAAGGGGGGAVAQSFFTGAQALSGTTIVVGAGGTAGASGLNNGGNGGQSNFGSLVAVGGSGAIATAAGSAPLIAGGGLGGIAAGGNIVALSGQNGKYGLVVASGAGVGGQGGANGLGWTGVEGNTSGQPGIAGANNGTGASGGCQGNSGGALAGAAGKQGIVMIFEYV
jgi:hypothetical protein